LASIIIGQNVACGDVVHDVVCDVVHDDVRDVAHIVNGQYKWAY
jgi:hypothetical protein